MPIVQNVNQDGFCNPETGQFADRYFREESLDVDILKDLAARGLLLGKEKIEHSYPHCYRCGEPLMYFAKTGWFLRTSSYKDKMLRANECINWYPDHIKLGRFGNWLESNVDWAISRERYWGSPLPIWTCKGCGERVCIGSLAELQELLGKPLPEDFDPHKPHIDRIELPCGKCGGLMQREPEVLDSWFNAGIMPWGQWGYPSTTGSVDIFEKQYPADFICEAIDQTRGWFYTLLATATLLTDESSFRNVICTELILDKFGQKMSKSRGKGVDPVELCEKYGADAVRWNFYRINPWTVRRFDEDELPESIKKVLMPYWNAYSFFVTYARVDNWRPSETDSFSFGLLDRWILSRLEWLRETIESNLDNYDVTATATAITTFIDELTNWYIRRSRRRFWKSEDDNDKQVAYHTLYMVIKNLNRMMAPLVPFISEAIYQNLERAYDASQPDSVHLATWTAPNQFKRDVEIEESMTRTREIVTMARSLRNEGGLRVRQPLTELVIAGISKNLGNEYHELILDELNIKHLRIVEKPDELFSYSAKADFKKLGPRFGKSIKTVAEEIANLTDKDIRSLLSEGQITIDGQVIETDQVILEQKPIEGYQVRTEGDLTVGIDNRITDDLYTEWLAREFVHKVQNMRRESDLDVTDRIHIIFNGSQAIQNTVKAYKSYISTETLATKIRYAESTSESEEISVGDQTGFIKIAITTIKGK